MIRQDEGSANLAECIEVAVVIQGQTIDEAVANLTEAVALHLEAEAPATFGLRERPTPVITLEVGPAWAQASQAFPARRWDNPQTVWLRHCAAGRPMKLKRGGPAGSQVLTIPAHAPLALGTLRVILRQASRFIPDEPLRPHFCL